MTPVCEEYITSQSKAGGKAVGRVAIAKLTNAGYEPKVTPSPPEPWIWEKNGGRIIAITSYMGPFRLKIEYLVDLDGDS